MSLDLSPTPGPRAHLSILRSPHKAEIDDRLFVDIQSVSRVHRWLTEEADVTDISYMSLTRYKHSRLTKLTQVPDDIRRREVRKDLRFLEQIIKMGKATLAEGLLLRPSEVMRAIELRAQLLQDFPDVSRDREAVFERGSRELADAVLSVVTEEQRKRIVERLVEIQSEQGRATS